MRDYIPLQQGLRQYKQVTSPYTIRERLYSITTRIKTEKGIAFAFLFSFGERLYSITTRIKTDFVKVQDAAFPNVRDYIPLQQGLRPLIPQLNYFISL